MDDSDDSGNVLKSFYDQKFEVKSIWIHIQVLAINVFEWRQRLEELLFGLISWNVLTDCYYNSKHSVSWETVGDKHHKHQNTNVCKTTPSHSTALTQCMYNCEHCSCNTWVNPCLIVLYGYYITHNPLIFIRTPFKSRLPSISTTSCITLDQIVSRLDNWSYNWCYKCHLCPRHKHLTLQQLIVLSHTSNIPDTL